MGSKQDYIIALSTTVNLLTSFTPLYLQPAAESFTDIHASLDSSSRTLWPYHPSEKIQAGVQCPWHPFAEFWQIRRIRIWPLEPCFFLYLSTGPLSHLSTGLLTRIWWPQEYVVMILLRVHIVWLFLSGDSNRLLSIINKLLLATVIGCLLLKGKYCKRQI